MQGRILVHVVAVIVAAVNAYQTPTARTQPQRMRHFPARLGFFDDLFQPKDDSWKDEQLREQQEILRRRRSPAAQQAYKEDMEQRRLRANTEANDKIAWQRQEGVDPLVEFKRRKEAGKLNVCLLCL